MAKDGLFFQNFARIHPIYETPVFGTIFTGLLSSTLAFFFDINALADMISIGTLLAFNMVCAGVLVQRYNTRENGKKGHHYTFALFTAIILSGTLYVCPIPWEITLGFAVVTILPCIALLFTLSQDVRSIAGSRTFICPFVPLFPAVGMMVNTYLMFQLGIDAVIRLVAWTCIGLIIYLFYGMNNSVLGLMERSGSSASNSSSYNSVVDRDTSSSLAKTSTKRRSSSFSEH